MKKKEKIDINDFYDTNVQNITEIKFKFPTFIVICSKSESGKTCLAKGIIKNLIDNNDVHHILIYSKTCMFEDEYNFIPEKNMIEYNKSEEHIKKIFEYQKSRIENNKKNQQNKKKVENILMIFDDIIISKKNEEIINLASLGRHYNITCIMSVQFGRGVLSPNVRGNIKYLFFNDLNYESEEAVYRSIHIPYKQYELHDFIDEHNDNYNFILYDNIEKNKRKRIKVVKSDLIDFEFY